MVEINQIAAIAPESISDDDLIIIWDVANARGYRATRGQFLNDVLRANSDAEVLNLSAESISANELRPASLIFNGDGTIETAIQASASITIPSVAAGATETIAVTVTDLTTDMMPQISFGGALPSGLIPYAFASAADTLTIRFTNVTGASIAGGGATARIFCIKTGS